MDFLVARHGWSGPEIECGKAPGVVRVRYRYSVMTFEFSLVIGEPGGDYVVLTGLVDGGTDGVTRHEYRRSKARTARQIRNFVDFQARTIAKTMP